MFHSFFIDAFFNISTSIFKLSGLLINLSAHLFNLLRHIKFLLAHLMFLLALLKFLLAHLMFLLAHLMFLSALLKFLLALLKFLLLHLKFLLVPSLTFQRSQFPDFAFVFSALGMLFYKQQTLLGFRRCFCIKSLFDFNRRVSKTAANYTWGSIVVILKLKNSNWLCHFCIITYCKVMGCVFFSLRKNVIHSFFWNRCEKK